MSIVMPNVPRRLKTLSAAMVLAVVFAAGGAQAQTGDAAVIAKGEYLAHAGDCAACHTAPGGKPFAGGLAFKLPIGTIYASNITPDPADGIGDYTEQDFARAVRQGIRKDGATLYPAMPFPSYARITDDDIHALYVYFKQGVQPVATPTPERDITWPLSMRWPLAIWRWVYGPGTPKPADVSDAELARGAYLVEGLGHCGACHTQRGLALEEKALTNRDSPVFLAGGGAVEGWVPQSLRSNPLTGLGAWSENDIAEFLKTGRNAHGSVFGGMSPVVQESTQYMTDADLHAMAHYLKTLSPDSSMTSASFHYDDAVAKQLQIGDTSAPGALAYVNNCASCHRTDGHGYPTVFPALAGNPVLQTQDAQGLIRIVLMGNTLPPTQGTPSSFTMPGFADRLSDQQVADLVSFIRGSWGNQGGKVTASDVAAVRKVLPPAAVRTVNAAEGPSTAK
jgi:mono/diheme cytochrome c family protein